jgi:hypothetical protein
MQWPDVRPKITAKCRRKILIASENRIPYSLFFIKHSEISYMLHVHKDATYFHKVRNSFSIPLLFPRQIISRSLSESTW